MDEVKSGGPGVSTGVFDKPLARNIIYYYVLPQSIFMLFNLLVTMEATKWHIIQ